MVRRGLGYSRRKETVLYLKNGVWTKGSPPKTPSSSPRVVTHRSQKVVVASSGRRLDALLEGRARICIKRCLAGDTKILMSDGFLKPIKDIEPGEFVVNMKGTPTEVLTKTYSGKPKEVVKIRSNRMLDPIICTAEHQFLVLDLREYDIPAGRGVSYYTQKDCFKKLIRWVPARELNEKTFLLLPSDLKLDLAKPTEVDLSFYLRENATSEVSEKEELDQLDFQARTKRFLPVGYNLGKFFGIILGDESHCIREKNGIVSSEEISIAVNSNYPEHVRDIKELVKDLFNLECSEYSSPKSKCIQLVFYSIPVARMLRKFGKKAEKKLPSEFLFGDNDYLRGLLDGLLQTDEYINSNGIESFDNTSPYLASLCYWLQSRLGKNPKIVASEPPISVLDDKEIKGSCRSFKVWTIRHKNPKSHQRITSLDGIQYDTSKILTKEILKEETEVWDIGVEGHSSFVAENTIVHNSLGGLGDIIMATPIARGAKRKYPGSHVTYAVPTDYAGGDLVALLEHNPFIDEIIDYSLVSRDDYDTFTDITRTGLSEEMTNKLPPNRIDLFANAAGIPLFGNFLPVYVMTEEERAWGEEYVKKATERKEYKGLISLHLGSRDPKRSWPHHRIREFIQIAKDAGYFTFLYEWGATADEWRFAGTNQVFDYGIRQAAAIIAATDLVVCPDSMILHLSGALNMRIVSLFGSMPPSCRINHYPNAVAVVNQQISCLGCIYGSCSNNFYCMSSLMPQSVLASVEQSMRRDIVEPSTKAIQEFIQPGVAIPKSIKTFTM